MISHRLYNKIYLGSFGLARRRNQLSNKSWNAVIRRRGTSIRSSSAMLIGTIVDRFGKTSLRQSLILVRGHSRIVSQVTSRVRPVNGMVGYLMNPRDCRSAVSLKGLGSGLVLLNTQWTFLVMAAFGSSKLLVTWLAISLLPRDSKRVRG